jgi:hypothetical protein
VARRFFSPTERADFKEQRICIKFRFRLNKTDAETHRMFKEEFGDNAMSQSKTFLWYKRFKGGQQKATVFVNITAGQNSYTFNLYYNLVMNFKGCLL